MKTLVVTNQKGGVGKTATVVHLAFHMAERLGLKVAVLDLDPQANATYSLQPSAITGGDSLAMFSEGFQCDARFDGPGIILVSSRKGLADVQSMPVGDAAKRFAASMKAIEATGADVCLCDTAPTLGTAMVSAELAATHVLSPIELEAYSIQGIQDALILISNIRKANRNLAFLGMLPSRVDNRNTRHAQHLAELRQVYPELVLPVSVPQRASIADALATQRAVWHIKGKTAAREAAAEYTKALDLIAARMEVK